MALLLQCLLEVRSHQGFEEELLHAVDTQDVRASVSERVNKAALPAFTNLTPAPPKEAIPRSFSEYLVSR
jgi:hypothetical protein